LAYSSSPLEYSSREPQVGGSAVETTVEEEVTELHATITISTTQDSETNRTWEARLAWGFYLIVGYGDLCSTALTDLLQNLGDMAPHWLLKETAGEKVEP